jgi:hypothetical protein
LLTLLGCSKFNKVIYITLCRVSLESKESSLSGKGCLIQMLVIKEWHDVVWNFLSRTTSSDFTVLECGQRRFNVDNINKANVQWSAMFIHSYLFVPSSELTVIFPFPWTQFQWNKVRENQRGNQEWTIQRYFLVQYKIIQHFSTRSVFGRLFTVTVKVMEQREWHLRMNGDA